MAMPTFLSAPPLAELGIGIDDLDPESLILKGLSLLFPNGEFNPINSAGVYNFTSLKYPDDIEHFFMYGHYMNFFVNVPVWSKYYSSESGNFEYPRESGGIIDDLFGLNSFDYGTANVDYFGGELPHVEGIGGDINRLRTRRITQAISLYIPDSMSYVSNIGYEDTSAFGEGKKFVDNLQQAVGQFFSSDMASRFNKAIGGLLGAGKVALGVAGFALNENLLVLFRGMGLREFSYDFFFSPKSASEAEAVRNIIRAFRFHAHPEVKFGYGLMYVAPGTFDITFMHRGKVNENIHHVSTCVLTRVDVDYAPMGWTTHVDGMPIQTRLSLTFKETEVMTKEKIAEGF